MDDFYAFYRLASGVLHGTQAGRHGRERTTFGRTFRLGPALAWCPLAVLYGAELLRILATDSSALLPVATAEVEAAMTSVKRVWPDFRKAVLTIDKGIWPSEPTPGRAAVFGMGPHGSGRWYLHDRDRGLIVPALPPEDTPQSAIDFIASVRKKLDDSGFWNDSDAMTGILGHVTIVVMGVQVDRDPRHEWMPDTAILVQGVEDAAMEEIPEGEA